MTAARVRRLAASAGAGLLCRREDALLFVPTVAETARPLIDVFVNPDEDDPAEAVAALTVSMSFEVGSFVAVRWRHRLDIMLFGDLQVTTNHASLPQMTGAGSSSWVEHHLRAADGESIDIEVGDSDWVPLSDLRAGAAPAGGFQLSVELCAASDVRVPVGPGEGDRRHPTLAFPAAPLDPAPKGGVDSAVDGEPPHSQALDPVEVLGKPLVPPDDGESKRVGERSVVAAYCVAGHANQPEAECCLVCGEPVAGDAVNVVSPRLGNLVLGDGRRVAVGGTLVFGRNPVSDDEGTERAILLGGERVSRRHAKVVVDGLDVYVEDLGSRNGTRLVVDGGEPEKINAGTPVRIAPGSTLFFGAEVVRYEPDTP